LLDGHCSLIDELIGVLDGQPQCRAKRSETKTVEATVESVLVPLLLVSGISGRTLHDLCTGNVLKTRDAYSVSRSLVETAINASFVIAVGEPAAVDAKKHAEAMATDDLYRQSVIANNVITSVVHRDGSSAAQKVFDTPQPAPKRTRLEWPGLSVDERIKRTGAALGQSVLEQLHWARFGIYRHSSETLHGTLFGALYPWEALALKNPTEKTSQEARIIGHHLLVLICSSSALAGTVAAFDAKYGHSQLNSSSKAMFAQLSGVI
jgi:hypothetical protein